MKASSLPASRVVRFGLFEVDLRSGELRKAGIKIKLYGQPFEILVALLERPGDIVTREELRDRLWPPDVFVDVDISLNKAINRLREALGDTADNSRFVETLPRRGYRLIVPVTPVNGPGRLTWRKRWLLVGVALALAGGLTGAAAYFYLRPHPFTEGETILLADFVNTAEDPVFDGALKQGLSLQLEQTPYLNVFPEAQARQVLPYMRLPADARLTPAIAREVCVRRGLKAMVGGSIASLGSHYVISLDAVNCKTGDPLGHAQIEADSREHVLAALGQAASKLRTKIGESLASIQEFSCPIDFTTNSLEALDAYNLAWGQEENAASIPFFKRAIALDPDFAMAYASLGTKYNNLGERALAAEYTEKAFAKKERVGPREKFYITSHYYAIVTGELEKEIETYKLWIETFPHAPIPLNNLALRYSEIGQYEKMLALSRDHQRFYPDTPAPYDNAAAALTGLHRYEEAKATYQNAIERKLESPDCHNGLYQIAFLQADSAAMRRHAAGCEVDHDGAVMRETEASAGAFSGRLQEARDQYRKALEIAQRSHLKELAASISASEGLVEATFGNPQQARREVASALAIARGPDAKYLAAAALALSGDVGWAQALSAELGKQYPTDTLLHSLRLPTVLGVIEINRGDPRKAIELLRPAAAYELGTNVLSPTTVSFLAVYVRGQAYVRTREGTQAAAEFQKILHHRGVDLTSPLYPLAHLGLARAGTLVGETAKSKKSYEDFFALWKDADPDIPILREAKAEYAKLN
jgi:eukaryotic-like serine/threonine-protein kinase